VVGPRGSVVGLELQPDLAARAKENLAAYASATVHAGDGAGFDPDPCDAIFVNCGVTHPQNIWLDRLNDRGRLVAPFTMAINATLGQGIMTKIVRAGISYSAEMVSPVAIFSGGNLRDPALEPLMAKALRSGGLLKTSRSVNLSIAVWAVARSSHCLGLPRLSVTDRSICR
jgi:protein-L-isoaspartate(D-aspartate) O-methyltransferase